MTLSRLVIFVLVLNDLPNAIVNSIELDGKSVGIRKFSVYRAGYF